MDNQNNKNNSPNNNRQGWGIILITTLLVAVVVMGLYSLMQGTGPEEISYDKFLKLVDSGKVEEVTLSSTRIYITLKDKADTDDSKDAASDAPENTAAGTGDGGEALGNDTGDGAGGAADNTVGGADTPGIQITRMRRTILRTPRMMLRQVRKITVQMCRITPQTRKNRMVIPQTWILKRTISSARSKSRQGAAERKNRITIRA